ncbi:hypothetical protein ACAW74_18300 [Fibrella sp. WM1]|uniref:hypothetical protein n=1 Tax=Fibrella musci TaxID=3242485 RepID=UPI0035215AC3
MTTRASQTNRAYYLAQLDVLESQRLTLYTELQAMQGRAWWWQLLNWGRISAVSKRISWVQQQCDSVTRLLNNPKFQD